MVDVAEQIYRAILVRQTGSGDPRGERPSVDIAELLDKGTESSGTSKM